MTCERIRYLGTETDADRPGARTPRRGVFGPRRCPARPDPGCGRPILTVAAIMALWFSLAGPCVQSATALATDPQAEGREATNQGSKSMTDDTAFEYRLEGRPDPFVPFITDKATTTKVNPDEIVEENVELTGMRLFEPGQLKLVAVLVSGGEKIAMVEDVTGKGYILKNGTPIGRRGVVSDIQEEQVIITETARTRSGKVIQNTVVMRLNKEGDN
ncbi:pilus assembly protein PilP [Desulfolithobacter sp.]